ncbi:MAG: hypothetical protein ABEJ08_04495 [Halobacteriaceae archaeon]
MLTVELDDFVLELDEGTIKHVGPSTKHGTAKLFDVEAATAREFGDRRLKLVFEDGEGNEVQAALFPEEAGDLADQIEDLRADSAVFD